MTDQHDKAIRKEGQGLREDFTRVLDLPPRKHVDSLPESKPEAKLNDGEMGRENDSQ